MRQFDIIGAGMGTRETLTGEAAQALASAEMVFATERLAEICENAQICLFSELAERAIACGADRAALLVSGDVGFFSAAGKLREMCIRDSCTAALERAKQGRTVAVVSSGDAGVYGMAGLLIELAAGTGVEVEVIPGITAACSGGAVLGSPLTLSLIHI